MSKLQFLQFAIFLFVTVTACANKKDYDGYKVFAITPQSDVDVKLLKSFEHKLDFWLPVFGINRTAHVMVNNVWAAMLQRMIPKKQIVVLVENVKTLIDKEAIELAQRVPFTEDMSPKDLTINQYHTYADIVTWMNALAQQYPNIASVITLGQTFQKNDLKMIKIGKASSQPKQAFWLDAGIHAREWIANAVAVYVINELVTKYSTNPTYQKYVDTIDFYIMPVMNVDGYDYTHTAERLWRKTRTGPHCTKGTDKIPKQCCYGVDANRNWAYKWGVSGSSPDPCSDTYDGPSAFSEPCIQLASNFLLTNNKTIRAYMNMHSYSEMWFYPYAWAPNTYPPNKDDLVALSNAAVEAIAAVHGTQYQAGTPADILYSASGSTMDWTVGTAYIPWSFGMELRPSGDSFYGFILPASQIIPTSEETWAGLQLIVQKLM